MNSKIFQINKKPNIQGEPGLPKISTETAIVTKLGIQDDYNKKHKIKPKTVQKTSKDILGTTSVADSMSDLDEVNIKNRRGDDFSSMDKKLAVDMMRQEMIESAENLNFEKAAKLRDEINILEKELSKIFK